MLKQLQYDFKQDNFHNYYPNKYLRSALKTIRLSSLAYGVVGINKCVISQIKYWRQSTSADLMFAINLDYAAAVS